MKIGMYYSNSDVRVEEIPVPEVGSKDILIKVMVSGICGSDIMEWYRIKRAPLVLGHEIAGEIVDVGSDINSWKPGDRVFSTHHVPCGTCRCCHRGHETTCEVFQTKNNFSPGGFSEYLRVTGKSVETGTLLLPDSVSYEQASFIEPLGTAVRCLRTAEICSGDTVLVLGSGMIGLLITQLARKLGAEKVIATDLLDNRLQAAKKNGAQHTVKASGDVPGFVKEVNGGMLADKVIVCAGSLPACRQAFDTVGKGGTVVLFAVPRPGEMMEMDFNPYWRNDVSIKTCYGAGPRDNSEALKLIESGDIQVDNLITHRFPLTDIQKGFDIACSGKEGLKVIIKPQA